MTPSLSPSDPALEEQAALWAARLDGDTLDRAQRAELDAWLAASPVHRALLSRYCQFSADLEETVPALVAAGRVAAPARVSGRPRRFPALPAFASLGVAAALIAVVATVMLRPPAAAVENFSTAVSQRSGPVTLSDGSRIEINAHTSLRFENSPAERRVRLASGEAHFAVAKDPARPFIVETPAGSVRVTGTTFNVRTEPAGDMPLEVTVVEGSVQVRPAPLGSDRPAEVVTLAAGDQLTATAAGVAKRALPPGALEDALAWRRGYIVFDDVPLRLAAARFARYHGRGIAVAETVAAEPVGGRYSLDDLSGFLDGVSKALGLDLTIDPSGAVFLGRR